MLFPNIMCKNEGEQLVLEYFWECCSRIFELSPILFKYDVFVEMDKYVPFRLNVTIPIYNVSCYNKKSYLKFVDTLKVTFEDAKNHLIHNGNIGYESIKVDIRVEVPKVISGCSLIDTQFNKFKVKEVIDMNTYCVPDVKEIIHSKSDKKGELFIVVWCDGTNTTVKLREGEQSDDYVAFMYCVSIKMFGSKGECRKFIKDKKSAFNERVSRRSEEKRLKVERKNRETQEKKSVPYAGGLISLSVPKSRR